MRLKQLRNDDSAVSPVIGVILMVAITVILAAVIATFVLGLGDQIGSNSPQASFSADYDGEELTISHANGDAIQSDELSIKGNTGTVDAGWSDTEVTAGDSITVEPDDGDTVRLVWEDPNGGSSATLYTWEG